MRDSAYFKSYVASSFLVFKDTVQVSAPPSLHALGATLDVTGVSVLPPCVPSPSSFSVFSSLPVFVSPSTEPYFMLSPCQHASPCPALHPCTALPP